MATHQIGILGWNAIPDASGEAFFDRYDIADTAAAISPNVLNFSDSGTKDGVRGAFIVPQNYATGAEFVVHWTANATSGTVTFDFSYLTRTAAEDMGAAATSTTDTVTDTKTGTAFVLETIKTSGVTDGDFVAGDICTFEIFRDTINDTMAANALVFDILFEYTD